MKYTIILLLIVVIITTGCCPTVKQPDPDIIIKREIVNIDVPIYVKAPLPPEITNLVTVEVPKFIAPTDKNAVVALDIDNLIKLKTLLLLLKDYRNATIEWSRTE